MPEVASLERGVTWAVSTGLPGTRLETMNMGPDARTSLLNADGGTYIRSCVTS
jgi:hypothetical protein